MTLAFSSIKSISIFYNAKRESFAPSSCQSKPGNSLPTVLCQMTLWKLQLISYNLWLWKYFLNFETRQGRGGWSSLVPVRHSVSFLFIHSFLVIGNISLVFFRWRKPKISSECVKRQRGKGMPENVVFVSFYLEKLIDSFQVLKYSIESSGFTKKLIGTTKKNTKDTWRMRNNYWRCKIAVALSIL